jgi:hypothetical protein
MSENKKKEKPGTGQPSPPDSLVPANAVAPEWAALLRLIPGYDFIATAGVCLFDIKAARVALDFFSEWLRHVEGDIVNAKKGNRSARSPTFAQSRMQSTCSPHTTILSWNQDL